MKRFLAWLQAREVRKLQTRQAELVACLAEYRSAGRVSPWHAEQLGGVSERLRQLGN